MATKMTSKHKTASKPPDSRQSSQPPEEAKASDDSKPNTPPGKGDKHKRGWTIAKLRDNLKAEALVLFADLLERFLSGRSRPGVPGPEIESESRLMEKLTIQFKQLLEKHPDYTYYLPKSDVNEFNVKQFANFLKELYQSRQLSLHPAEAHDCAQKISDFSGVPTKVVRGTAPTAVAKVAAVEFIKRFCIIGKRKKQQNRPLFIGIVSGSSTGAAVDALCNMNWPTEGGFESFADIGDVHVFALNVSFTDPDHIASHATILAYNLAKHIRSLGGRASAHGLNSEFLVDAERARKNDADPQTRLVLAYTEPARIGDTTPQAINVTTHLDILLTGVGVFDPNAVQSPHRPASSQSASTPDRASVFTRLITDGSIFSREDLDRFGICGDLAFTPLDYEGKPVSLVKGSTEYTCYSAASITVFDAMSKDSNKAVILVANDPAKARIIYACICPTEGRGAERHVNRLIVDEETGRALVSRMS